MVYFFLNPIFTKSRNPLPHKGLRHFEKRKNRVKKPDFLVGVTGFEPAASWSRTKRSTELSHTPKEIYSVLVCTSSSVFTTESAPLLSYGLRPLHNSTSESKTRSVVYTELSHTPKEIQLFFVQKSVAALVLKGTLRIIKSKLKNPVFLMTSWSFHKLTSWFL